jgi:uncharacterized damage-inducible protein DinB
MQPDQAIFLFHFLLPQLKSEQAITEKILSAVPPDKGDYKPDAKCMSARGLAWHIALKTAVDFIGLRNDPAVAYMNIAIRHSVHHRRQLSTYLRAMGAKVPAIYVESADEPYPPVAGSAAAENGQSPPAF